MEPDNEPLTNKIQHGDREYLALQTDLNILTNKQRAEQAEIAELRNMISLLVDAISRNIVSIGVTMTAKDIETKLRQIENDIRNMRFDYDRSMKEKQIEKLRFKKGDRMLPSGNKKIGDNKNDDEKKIREINTAMLKIRRDYESKMREKDFEVSKLEEARRTLRQSSAKKENSKTLDEAKLKRLTRLLEEKEEDCRKREILIKNLKQELHYI